MAMIETKFSIGDLVKHFTGIPGMVTAIFHRSGKNSYEFSFLHEDKPTCVNAEEYELYSTPCDSLGFKKN